ncbi:MAG: DUF308 domain-containing protein [Clostridia bacterium]|nr:DUF308 domain-containing protein [Clostridia bacterium]
MAKQIKKLDSNLITAILYVVVGALFCIFKGEIISWIMTIVGVLYIVQGVMDVLNKDLIKGVINAGIGVLILVLGWLFVAVASIIFGVLIIIKGAKELLEVLKAKKKNIFDLIAPIVTIVIGAMLIAGKFLDWLFIVVGVIFIINGVLELLGKKK